MQGSYQSTCEAERRSSPLLGCGESFGLKRAKPGDFEAVRSLAVELIGPDVAAASALAAADASHPGAVLTHTEQMTLTGFLAVLPLRGAGRDALLAGWFDGVAPEAGMICAEHEVPAAVYAWGCAARTRPAARAVMAVTAALPDAAWPGVVFFARAATPAGLRALTQALGYAPVGGGLLQRQAGLRRAA